MVRGVAYRRLGRELPRVGDPREILCSAIIESPLKDAGGSRAVTLARRGVGVFEMAYVLITVAGARRELGDRRSAIELVREARELSSQAPDLGTVLPRLLDKVERSLRLVSERRDSRLVAFEELTAREAAVLRLLPTGLSAREIGQELGVSRNTVKTHSKNLYRKLGATGSREAVARGRELGLL
jgi:LuxR family transcriptional regulator, maltose regulon positive regulatory protein